MKILGIGGSSHDYSFCIVNNGVIEVAVEEERFSRERHATGYRSNAFSGLYQLLQSTQTELKDYDLIVANSLMSPELLKKISAIYRL